MFHVQSSNSVKIIFNDCVGKGESLVDHNDGMTARTNECHHDVLLSVTTCCIYQCLQHFHGEL